MNLSNEITTGISPPPIGRTKPIPANNIKTKNTEKKLAPSKFTKAGINDANRKIKEM